MLTKKSVARLIFTFLASTWLAGGSAWAVSETDLPGHSLFLHVKQYAAPFPGPGNYTIDFAASGHAYSIIATGAITSASGAWSFRQGDLSGSVVITLDNYFGDGTGAEIVLLNTGYYELYAGTANQDGNWSLEHFVQDPIFSPDLADMTGPENGSVTFTASLLNGISGVTLQWFKDGVLIAGANKVSLTLTGLNQTMAGFYSVQASQGSDTNVSRAAHLTVVTPQIAMFNGRTFETILTNNAPAPGLPPTDPTNAFRLKGPSQVAWENNELTFLAEYAGKGTNKNKTGTGLFAISNGVPRKLVLSSEIMPGTASPYLSIGGFSFPDQGRFLFYGVAGGNNYAIVQWNGTTAASLLKSQTAIPGNSSVQFQYFGAPGGHGWDAAFAGYGPGAAGLYEFQNGQPVLLLDKNSTLPGFPAPPLGSLDVSTVPAGVSPQRLLTVREPYSNLYEFLLQNTNGALETILDGNTVYPGTTMPMPWMGGTAPIRSGDLNVFLLGDANNQSFLVTVDLQGLHGIAKTGDLLPGGSARINRINRMGLTAVGIVFDADTTENRRGVYLSQAGQISTVIDTLSLVGTNLVSSVGLLSANDTNVVINVALYGSALGGIAVNTGVAPSAPLNFAATGHHFKPDGRFSVKISGEPGTLVVLEHSFDLNHWESIATNTLNVSPMDMADDDLRAGAPAGFYRLRTAQP